MKKVELLAPAGNYESLIGAYTINYDLKQLFRALTGKMKIYDWLTGR